MKVVLVSGHRKTSLLGDKCIIREGDLFFKATNSLGYRGCTCPKCYHPHIAVPKWIVKGSGSDDGV
jgi:hypothetical protein